jgi:hypothetical protein
MAAGQTTSANEPVTNAGDGREETPLERSIATSRS